MISNLIALLFFLPKLHLSLQIASLITCLFLWIVQYFTSMRLFFSSSSPERDDVSPYKTHLIITEEILAFLRYMTRLSIESFMAYALTIYVIFYMLLRPSYPSQLQLLFLVMSSIGLVIIFFNIPCFLGTPSLILSKLNKICNVLLIISIFMLPVKSLWDEGRYSGPFTTNAAFTQFLIISLFLYLHSKPVACIKPQINNTISQLRSIVTLPIIVFLILMSGSRSSLICSLLVFAISSCRELIRRGFFRTFIAEKAVFCVLFSLFSLLSLINLIKLLPVINIFRYIFPRATLPNPLFDRFQQWMRFSDQLPELPILGISPAYRFFTCHYNIYCFGYNSFTTDPHNLYLNTVISFGPFFSVIIFLFLFYCLVISCITAKNIALIYPSVLFLFIFLFYLGFGGGTLFSFNSLLDRFFFISFAQLLTANRSYTALR
jgi:hypothetical protein